MITQTNTTNIEHRTKSQIHNAAVKVFTEKGLYGGRVSDIVSEAGFAQGTFYKHFKSKESLFNSLCESCLQSFTVGINQQSPYMFDGNSEAEVRESFCRFVKNIIQIYFENRALADLLLRDGVGPGGNFQKKYEELVAHFITLINKQIDNAAEKGLVSSEDTKSSSVFTYGLFVTGVYFITRTKRQSDRDMFIRNLANHVLNGLLFKFI